MTKKRRLTALPARPGQSWHALIWVETERVQKRHGGDGLAVRAVSRRVWPLRASNLPPDLFTARPFEGPDSLAALLPALAPPKKGLTLWLARGWEDMVMSGLAELIDRGLYRYRWLTLDGQRVIAQGRLGKRRLDVTSLAAWTGGEWDGWREQCAPVMRMMMDADPEGDCKRALATASADETCALSECLTVLDAARSLQLGPVKLSIGAQARSWWRTWGGPRFAAPRPLGGKGRGKRPKKPPAVLCPVPRRPLPAAWAESHCCFGLVREQYARGHVGGPVHVLDLQSAYLLALASVQLPAVYARQLSGPSPAELSASLIGGAGCALVRLRDTEYPYCIKRHDKPIRALGSYWCWLAEPDLDRALHNGTVAECKTAWVWRHVRHTARCRDQLLSVAPQLKANGLPHLAALWRQLYASCVGGWAQRAWEWLDVEDREAPARWMTWTALSPDGERVEHWRAVGGRVQRREYQGEAPHSLPLLYATCTAHVRQAVDWVRSALPAGSVLATACDALWLTDAGLAAFRHAEGPLALAAQKWRVKDTYDDAWLDGKGQAVVRKGDYLYPLLPGIPAGVCVGADGLASWPRAAEWDAAKDVRPDKPLPRRRVRWDGGRVMRANDHPLKPVSPFVTLNDPVLDPALLAAYDPCRASLGPLE
jgi:hypothetical protein